MLNVLGKEANLHLVGGCLRNKILNLEISDLDFASKFPAETVTQILNQANIRTIDTGPQHQTITCLPVPEMPSVEITSFRTSNWTPESSGGIATSIYEDLNYRDFTINAIAIDLNTNSLIDPHNGIKDIESKCIKAIGIPKDRFKEDPLRVLRMIRFLSIFNFNIEKQTLLDAKEFIEDLKHISVERVQNEFSKTLCGQYADTALRKYDELGILDTLFPEIKKMVSFEQNKFHHLDVFEHTLAAITNCEPNLELRLAALLHDIAKPLTLSVDENGDRHFYKHETVGANVAKQFLQRLKYSKKVTNTVVNLVKTHMRPLKAGDAGLRRLLRDTEGHYILWRKLKEADSFACKIDSDKMKADLEEFDKRIIIIKEQSQNSPFHNLAINGNDLMALGFKANKKLGDTMKKLQEMVIDNPSLNTKDRLLEIAKDLL